MSRKNIIAAVGVIVGVLLLLLLTEYLKHLTVLGNLFSLHYFSGAYSQAQYVVNEKTVFYWRSTYLYFPYLFVFTLTFSFPLLVTLWKGNSFAKKHGSQKELLWKMPLYTIPPIIGVFLIEMAWDHFALHNTIASGESSLVMFLVLGLPILFPMYVAIYSLIAFFLASVLYSKKNAVKIVGILSLFLVIAFLLAPSLKYMIQFGPGIEYNYG